MIEKQIHFGFEDEEFSLEKISPSEPLEKTASNEMSDEIKNFIKDNIESDPNHVYVLVSALGSGEIWGDNVNADYFEEEEILNHYKTFEKFGYVFTHHKNKDPKNSKGDILFSHFNPRMHRVELVVKIDRRKAPKIAADIDKGKMWDVSMGCKVPHDICSICGNVAKTRDDYCTHIKNHKGEVLPDGRKVYMINKNPRFFDISFVYIGADRTAKSLKKIASKLGIDKKADIDKEIPGDIISEDAGKIAATLMKSFSEIKPLEKTISNKVLDFFSEKPIEDVLTSLITLGIVLKPEEFQRIYLNRLGYDPDDFDDIIINMNIPENETTNKFKPLGGQLDFDVVKIGIPYIKERSAIKEYLYPRLVKMASEEREVRKKRFRPSQLATPGIVAGSLLYSRYLNEVPDYNAEGLDKTIKEHPWVLPAVTAGSVGLVRGMDEVKRTSKEFEKTASNLGGRIFAGVPAAYLASDIAGRFDSDAKLMEFIEKHPNLVAMLGIGATNSKDDWAAIKKALSGLQKDYGPMITKEAAEMISPKKSAPDLINDTDRLYNKYKEIDKKYNTLNNIGNLVITSTNPMETFGRGVDMLAGTAIKKLIN
jgi:hypothetical protein